MVARSHARADVSAITPGVISGLDRTGRFAAYALAAVTVAGVLVQAFIFENLVDRFLMIKDVALRAQAIVSLFLLSAALLHGGWSRFRSLFDDRLVAALLAAIPAWTLISALGSTSPVHSHGVLITVVTVLIVFVSAWFVAPLIGFFIFDALAIACIGNSILAALQEFQIYQPIVTNLKRRLSVTH